VQYKLSEAKAWAREKLVGQWTTMVTPFTPDDRLDEPGLAHNVEHVLKLGTRGMGFSWNMGEFWSLTREERYRLMEVVPGMVRGRALTAFQVTDTSAKEVVAMAAKAQELGYDLVILAAPYMMAKTEEAVLEFTRKVAGGIGMGIAFYNSPQFGFALSAKALGKIAEIPNVAAIKEASFNMQISLDTHLQSGSKAVISTPDEEIFFFEEYYKFHQQVMFANTSDWRFDTPSSHHYVEFIELATQGRLEEAKKLYPKVWPVKELSRRWWGRIAGRTGGALPVPLVKYWGELLGMRAGHVRPPLYALTAEEREELRRDLSKLMPLAAPV
jgi:4-hydroxy-tetrahydrodipicolinate synthase